VVEAEVVVDHEGRNLQFWQRKIWIVVTVCGEKVSKSTGIYGGFTGWLWKPGGTSQKGKQGGVSDGNGYFGWREALA
jgi:hypothetical protein